MINRSNRVQRYEWEDLVLRAESLGLISSGATNMCLRLASAITWEPKNRDRSGLYWKNETALKSVGSSKATYHRHRDQVFAAGLFIEIGGNLIPQLPDLSQFETTSPQIETVGSQVETAKSQVDSLFTVDTFTDTSFSGESISVDSPIADAPGPGEPEEVSPIKKNDSHAGPSDSPDADAPVSSFGLNQETEESGNLILKKILIKGDSLDSEQPAGMAPDSRAEARAREDLSLIEKLGPGWDLSDGERDRAVALIIDPAWQRGMKPDHTLTRAKSAAVEVRVRDEW